MSLKAKIEAVIYASEEPVTLLQLVGLLGHEAQAELDRIAAMQRTLALHSEMDEENPPTAAGPEELNDEVLTGEDAEGGVDSEDRQMPSEFPPPDAAEEESAAREAANVEEADGAETAPVSPAEQEDPTGSLQGGDPKQIARNEKDRARRLRDFVRSLLDELMREYATSDRGLEIREVAGGFRLATKPEYHDAVRGFVKSLKPPLKLSLQALETLAVVAYKQPVTAPEVSEIRGVDSGGVLGSLMARKLVATAGRKQVIGRPILYKTTKDFLLRFGLKDINELPSIEEFERMAGELIDSEPIQEEIPMSQSMSAESAHTDPELARGNQSVDASITGANLEEEKDATEPQADGDGATVDSVTPDGRSAGVMPPQDSYGDTDTSAAEADIQRRDQNEGQE